MFLQEKEKNLNLSSLEISTVSILLYIFPILKKNLIYTLCCLLNMFTTYMKDKENTSKEICLHPVVKNISEQLSLFVPPPWVIAIFL